MNKGLGCVLGAGRWAKGPFVGRWASGFLVFSFLICFLVPNMHFYYEKTQIIESSQYCMPE